MHATVLQPDLNKGLGIVSRVVATRGQLPVLANVLIEASKEGLTLAATNLEIGLRVRVGGKVTEPGAVTIPGKNLGELVGSLPGESLDLQTEGEKLKIKTGKSAGMLTGIAASEFPAFAKATAGQAPIKIKKELLLEIASQFQISNPKSQM
ncbi:MAG: polymerase III subunit beta protein [Candidatus Amesbacteria bacterium GW2011_GWA2_47_70]|nr:MAG: polymerase III subunit beta protein [Candidatus Amesbacteria bacterium GW2011_GWA2_47_70]